MKKARAWALQFPLIFSILIIVFSSLMTELPLKPFFEQFMDARKAHFVNVFVQQSVCALLLYFIVKALGVFDTAGFSKPKHVWLGWPLIVMGLLNVTEYIGEPFPFNTTNPMDYILYVLVVVSVGFIEEIMARSLILNVMLRKWGGTKKGIMWAVFVSSVLFGLSHLLTVINGMRELTAGIIQAFTTTFFGVLFAALFLRNRSVWPIIVLHAFVDLFACSHDLTARFGEVHVATVEGAIASFFVALVLLVYSLVILRKVKPDERPETKTTEPGYLPL